MVWSCTAYEYGLNASVFFQLQSLCWLQHNNFWSSHRAWLELRGSCFFALQQMQPKMALLSIGWVMLGTASVSLSHCLIYAIKKKRNHVDSLPCQKIAVSDSRRLFESKEMIFVTTLAQKKFLVKGTKIDDITQIIKEKSSQFPSCGFNNQVLIYHLAFACRICAPYHTSHYYICNEASDSQHIKA